MKLEEPQWERQKANDGLPWLRIKQQPLNKILGQQLSIQTCLDLTSRWVDILSNFPGLLDIVHLFPCYSHYLYYCGCFGELLFILQIPTQMALPLDSLHA